MNLTFIQNQRKLKTNPLAAALLLTAALLLSACQPASVPNTGSESGAEAVLPTSPAVQAANTATDAPESTEEPAETELPASTEAPAATQAPIAGDAVTVSDQDLAGNTVTIDQVMTVGPAWVVIHADAEGKPGPVLGFAPVEAGENAGVQVEIDVENVTQTLHAMLHSDAGQAGVYEFPGEDVPAKMDGQMVSPSFQLTGGLAPSILVEDTALEGGRATIPQVFSEGPGWLVIHAEVDGKPGPVLGYAPLQDGFNLDVEVEVDAALATGTVYAMLHADAGQVGEYEFPGADTPVMVAEKPVMKPFMLSQAGAASAQAENQVVIEHSSFTPGNLTIPPGTTVVWVNNDGMSHTVTADDGSFDSGTLRKGDTFEFTFTEAGTFAYYCAFHGDSGGRGMSGTIQVGAGEPTAAEPSPEKPTEDDYDYDY